MEVKESGLLSFNLGLFPKDSEQGSFHSFEEEFPRDKKLVEVF